MKVEYSSDKKIAYYNGERFTRDDRTGYYLSARKVPELNRRIRLHKYVWTMERGEIPAGCQIHHKDENKYNNDIDNLECLSEHDHLSYHSMKYAKERRDDLDRALGSAREAAKAWHKSAAGHEWHLQHYNKVKAALHKERSFVCEVCGKPFKSIKASSRFCSNNCRAAYRRASGVDDIPATCPICGKSFMTNKYSSAKTCSSMCRGAMIRKARQAV